MDLFFAFKDSSAIDGSAPWVHFNGLMKLIPLAFLYIKVTGEQSTFGFAGISVLNGKKQNKTKKRKQVQFIKRV